MTGAKRDEIILGTGVLSRPRMRWRQQGGQQWRSEHRAGRTVIDASRRADRAVRAAADRAEGCRSARRPTAGAEPFVGPAMGGGATGGGLSKLLAGMGVRGRDRARVLVLVHEVGADWKSDGPPVMSIGGRDGIVNRVKAYRLFCDDRESGLATVISHRRKKGSGAPLGLGSGRWPPPSFDADHHITHEGVCWRRPHGRGAADDLTLPQDCAHL